MGKEVKQTTGQTCVIPGHCRLLRWTSTPHHLSPKATTPSRKYSICMCKPALALRPCSSPQKCNVLFSECNTFFLSRVSLVVLFVSFFACLFLFVFLRQGLLYSSGCPGTYYVNQVDGELTEIQQPLLGLKASPPSQAPFYESQ